MPAAGGQGQNPGFAGQQLREPKFAQAVALTMPWLGDSDEVAVCLHANVLPYLSQESTKASTEAFTDGLRQRAVIYLGVGPQDKQGLMDLYGAPSVGWISGSRGEFPLVLQVAGSDFPFQPKAISPLLAQAAASRFRSQLLFELAA